MILVDTNILLRVVNDADFTRFREISTLNPFDVMSLARI